MDALADLLDGVRARTAAFCRTVLEPPWALRIVDEAPLALAIPLRGNAWLVPDEGEPVLIQAGDIAIVKGPDHYTVGDRPGTRPEFTVHAGNRVTAADGTDITDAERLSPFTTAFGPTVGGDVSARGDASAVESPEATVIASGTYQVAGDVSGRLLAALPPMVRVPRDTVQSPVMDLLAEEVRRDAPGQQVVLDRLLDLALIAALRAWFDRPAAEPPGWYRAQGDPVVGRGLRAVHGRPAEPWTVNALAAESGVSRAAFARRFADLVGQPPMTYLTGYRIDMAADLLRDSDATVEAIARRVGYANAFALSVAFKRERGITPRQHRARDSAGPSPISTSRSLDRSSR